MKTNPNQPKGVASSEYSKEYYQTACQGYQEFNSSGGAELPLRLSIPLELAAIQPGMKIIDVGCGRGEIILRSAKLGAFALSGLPRDQYPVRFVPEGQAKSSRRAMRGC